MPTQIPVHPRFHRRAVAVALAAALLAPGLLRAQTAAPASPLDTARTLARYDLNQNGRLDPEELAAQQADRAKAAKAEEAVILSPFEVRTDKDTSYGALNSNSITAFNTELLKTPVAADIFTEQFMQDVGTTTVEDLLNNYGAGVGVVLATPDSDSNNNQPGDRFSVSQVGSRGLTAGATRRDGFQASSTRTSITDTFDTERVEVIKGANAMLYGASGAGGLANTGSKQARFGTDASVPKLSTALTYRIDQYGSNRVEFDTNWGLDRLAVRFVALNEDQNYRRLYIGSKTQAYYTTLSARLPFRTLLRVSARKQHNDRIIPTRGDNLSFTNATRDPRHNFSLLYLLATNQGGATNPATGAAYPAGPIVNGLLSWDNASSWSGWTQSEDKDAETYTLNVESVWTKWLSTQVAAMYEHSYSQRGPDGGTLLAPNTLNRGQPNALVLNTGNPFDEWANSSSFRMDRNAGKRHAYRASALISNELFRGRAKSQTVFGYDLDINNGGNTNYQYYEADGNFNLVVTPGAAGADALGRIGLPTQYWSVQSGPVKKPGARIGSRRITVNGKNYVLEQRNPRSEQWVNPTNPLGLATLAGFNSVGGSNASGYAEENKFFGLYGANYTSWFNDRFTTMVGYRLSTTFSRRPNTSTAGTQAWNEIKKDNKSYNLGLAYRIRPWLYGYYNVGQTFEPAKGSNDPLGKEPLDTEGLSQEIGLKYEPRGGLISGSLTYFMGESTNENFNYGGTNRDLINPVGINDAFNAAARNQWVNLDKKARGIEVMLTAAPTKNWRARLGFTQQNGTILTASSFPMQWNDEFYYSKASGGVTYADGTPFLVPTDAAGVTAVSRLGALAAPVAGSARTQLTVGMMSDPNSDYYAYGKGGTINANGRITNNSVVFRALRWFQLPGGLQARTLRTGLPVSDIPYAYGDPVGYKGVVTLSNSGDPTIGHPLYRFVFTNTYEVTEGWFRGVTVGGTMRWDIDQRTYWYFEPAGGGGLVRKLYKQVDVNPQVSPFLTYRRKIGRYAFRTQLNVNNVFNKYKVDLRPDAATGFTNEANIGATFVGEPRQFVWTNSVAF